MRTKKLSSRISIEYILVFLLISISGNPFFNTDQFLIFTFLLSLSVFIYRKKKFTYSSVTFFSLFVLVTILQAIKFDYFPILTYGGIYLKVFIAYLIVKILNFKFITVYVKVFYFISLISLMCYGLTNILPGTLSSFLINTSPDSLYPRYSFYGLYTLIETFEYRNCGPFWEAGAFSGYLIMTLVFNYFGHYKKRKRIHFVLLISLITTFSSTGYLCAFIFYFLTNYKIIKSLFLKTIIFFLFLIGGYFAISSISFLGPKIQNEISKFKNTSDLNSDSSRLFSLVKDFDDIKGHALIGRGFHASTRFKFKIENQIRTFGLSDIAVKLGLPFFIYMMFLAYSSFKSYLSFNGINSNIITISVFVTFFLTLFSQAYFNYSLFWCFLFLNFTFVHTKKLRLNNSI